MDKKTSRFLTLAKEKHGNKFGYQFLNYIKASKPIEIVCPTHGRQFITASIHLRGEGCPLCAKEAGRLKKIQPPEVYIEKAVKVHGDKYDYSLLKDFMPMHRVDEKIPIICKKHGVFYQDRSNHLHGQGCPKCQHENMFFTTEEFIRRSNILHNNKYDYSLVKYERNDKKVTIICPIHGKFEQAAGLHMSVGYGCPKCKIITIANKRRLTLDTFIEKSRAIHGDKYDYSKVGLGNGATRKQHVTIICPIHGEFRQQPAKHMDGDNCPKCSGKYQMTTEEFKDVIRELYGGKYDLSKTKYTRKDGKCIIGCPVHGFVKNSIESLRRGAGCNKCNASVGENLISRYLDKVKIPYEREYPIRNFGDINRYRYDFYLPTLNIVIEFHGKQHYDVVKYFGGESRFKESQERDSYKENFLKIVGVPLLVIKYTQVNDISMLIANFIHKLFPYEYKGILYHSMNKLLKVGFIDPHTPVEDIIKQYNSLTYLTSPLTKQLVN